MTGFEAKDLEEEDEGRVSGTEREGVKDEAFDGERGFIDLVLPPARRRSPVRGAEDEDAEDDAYHEACCSV